MFRSNTGIIQSRGNRVGIIYLAMLILEKVGSISVKYTGRTASQTCRMLSAINAVTRRFNAAQLAFIERVQNPAAPWLNVIEHAGLEQAKTLVEDLVGGRIDPKDGHAVVLD